MKWVLYRFYDKCLLKRISTHICHHYSHNYVYQVFLICVKNELEIMSLIDISVRDRNNRSFYLSTVMIYKQNLHQIT
jgi:hypothetical protein